VQISPRGKRKKGKGGIAIDVDKPVGGKFHGQKRFLQLGGEVRKREKETTFNRECEQAEIATGQKTITHERACLMSRVRVT